MPAVCGPTSCHGSDVCCVIAWAHNLCAKSMAALPLSPSANECMCYLLCECSAISAGYCHLVCCIMLVREVLFSQRFCLVELVWLLSVQMGTWCMCKTSCATSWLVSSMSCLHRPSIFPLFPGVILLVTGALSLLGWPPSSAQLAGRIAGTLHAQSMASGRAQTVGVGLTCADRRADLSTSSV